MSKKTLTFAEEMALKAEKAQRLAEDEKNREHTAEELKKKAWANGTSKEGLEEVETFVASIISVIERIAQKGGRRLEMKHDYYEHRTKVEYLLEKRWVKETRYSKSQLTYTPNIYGLKAIEKIKALSVTIEKIDWAAIGRRIDYDGNHDFDLHLLLTISW